MHRSLETCRLLGLGSLKGVDTISLLLGKNSLASAPEEQLATKKVVLGVRFSAHLKFGHAAAAVAWRFQPVPKVSRLLGFWD